MASFKNRLVFFLLLSFSFPFLGTAQDDSKFDVNYEINRVLPYISITKGQLDDVKILSDLDPQFKPSWVRKYIGVEILAYTGGIKMKGLSKNDTLSFQQMNLLKTTDIGSDVLVIVKYMPENSLKHNDPKEFSFTFNFSPENNAEYIGDQEELMRSLKESVIDKIPSDSFEEYNLAAVQFTITEEGEVSNVGIFKSAYQTFDNKEINDLLLKTVRDMPCWKPAEYANGTKVKQDFILTAGDMRSCFVNLLNIKKLAVEEE